MRRLGIGDRKGDIAFFLSCNSVHILILYFSLFSLDVVISPENLISSKPEILHQIQLSKLIIAFVMSDVAHTIPNLRTIIFDASEFESLMVNPAHSREMKGVKVYQSKPAMILYSLRSTSPVKGVNFTYMVVVNHVVRSIRTSPIVCFCLIPYFHVYGLYYFIRALTMGETIVSMSRFDMMTILTAIQEFRITYVALAPLVVVLMTKDHRLIDDYDLSFLEVVGCGGALTMEEHS
uniref:AMP-dependent synthetase/ligase domain-containing protein n=1 Tax=Manihot esculenta TaxID=3983 RepID=A0A2C9V5R1_MANES